MREAPSDDGCDAERDSPAAPRSAERNGACPLEAGRLSGAADASIERETSTTTNAWASVRSRTVESSRRRAGPPRLRAARAPQRARRRAAAESEGSDARARARAGRDAEPPPARHEHRERDERGLANSAPSGVTKPMSTLVAAARAALARDSARGGVTARIGSRQVDGLRATERELEIELGVGAVRIDLDRAPQGVDRPPQDRVGLGRDPSGSRSSPIAARKLRYGFDARGSPALRLVSSNCTLPFRFSRSGPKISCSGLDAEERLHRLEVRDVVLHVQERLCGPPGQEVDPAPRRLLPLRRRLEADVVVLELPGRRSTSTATTASRRASGTARRATTRNALPRQVTTSPPASRAALRSRASKPTSSAATARNAHGAAASRLRDRGR